MTPPTVQETLAVSAAVSAAMQSGLLLALVDRPGEARELAARTNVDARAAGLVLELLSTTDLVVKREDGTFGAGDELAKLCASAPLGPGTPFRLFGHVGAFLADGAPISVMRDAVERESTYRDVVDALARMFAPIARELAGRLERAPSHVLDIGCGSGVWSLSIAEQFPSARVTGLDLPAVASRFVARAGSLGLADRTATIAGDVHEVELAPRAYDLVVVANVLRIEDEARACAIATRAADASSREVLVVDALAEGDDARRRARATYALNLALRSRDGAVHPRERIEAWLGAAGMRLARVIPFADPSIPNAALLFSR